MTSENILSRISICLVEPEGQGNIGSVARAMKNMGVSRLIIVKGVDPDCNLTRQMASGAYDIIENAKFCDSLKEAVASFSIVAGTSRRMGKSRNPSHFVKEFPQIALPLIQAGNEAVILFGRERSGLTTEELDLCQYRIFIPTNPAHGSLNIAQAVLLTCYEIANAADPAAPAPERKLATSEEMERMYEHIMAMATETGFLNPQNPAWIMRAFRNILGRSGMNSREVRVMRGFLSDIEWYINHCIKAGKRDGGKPEED